MALCFYKIWLTKKDFKLQRFCLRSMWYAYLLALLALYSTAESLYRLVMGISVLNLDGQTGLAPFEKLKSIFVNFDDLFDSGSFILCAVLHLYMSEVIVQVFGVLCEAQYFQNVMRAGYRLRATLVAAVFRKSLRLTHEGQRKFASGKITNLMTTDAEALQQICQSLHTLWSAPFRIIVAMVLLYQHLNVASLLGALMLVLLFPIQTFVISRMQKLSKEGLQRTDKRIGLMNEILAAMDTVKCYAWESSFQAKVQGVRDDELSWFRKASLLGAEQRNPVPGDIRLCNSFILKSIPVMATVISFGMYTLLGGNLTPARAFTSLSLFAVLRFPLSMLPNMITQVLSSFFIVSLIVLLTAEILLMGTVKEEGTFEDLSNNGMLFRKLMGNAGKMEEYEEQENNEIVDNKTSSKQVANGVMNNLPKNVSGTKKPKEGKSVLIKQEERETGVVNLKVLTRTKDKILLVCSMILAPMFILSSLMQSTAREVKRLDSITRSPVYAQFGEALNGLSTIRAYKAYDRMASINGKSMDNNVRYTLVNMGANRWLAIRLETLGGIMIRFTATFAVMQNGRADNQQAFASTMGLLLKLERGRILIDDCDIAKFGLMDLRKVLGIIPQSPVLFSVDRPTFLLFRNRPTYNDGDLWEALERAHSKMLSEGIP
ncbi:hypothetical protein POTOM_039673 [Populus tomentosa]|uniref:ABC transmembrane type-1 domain-containing protein n=1 Tax=Populus tomentosa TaxID=118781 RepID=A0A8X7YMY0_POPTO|nr:hypothetical protein POTOM_039673 [Populus tomentosa]